MLNVNIIVIKKNLKKKNYCSFVVALEASLLYLSVSSLFSCLQLLLIAPHLPGKAYQ